MAAAKPLAEHEEVFVVDPSVRARARERRVVTLFRLLLCVGFLAFWELASGPLVSEFWVSKPSAIALALSRLWADGVLLKAILTTVMEAIAGFGIGATVGVLLGVLLGVNRVVARVLDPFLIGFYSVPRVALIPLFVLWFGIGFQMKVIFTALLVFFPIFMNTLSGVRGVDHDLIDVIRVMGASRLDTIRKVFFPSALAWVFAGLRISVPYALIGAVVAEMFSSNAGLGHLISLTANQFDTAGLFAALAVTTAVGLVLDAVVRLFEQRLLRWQPRKEG
jgi:NitT/TauT family transport system permease protein